MHVRAHAGVYVCVFLFLCLCVCMLRIVSTDKISVFYTFIIIIITRNMASSPVLESTTLSKSASSEDDSHNNSTATSLGSVLDGFDGDGGGDRHQLLAFSMDSADLSWSSSMATPPNAAVESGSSVAQQLLHHWCICCNFYPCT